MPTPIEQPNTGAARDFALPGSSGYVTGTGEGEYLGFSLRETSGSAAATVVLFDNTAASGSILEEIQLAQGASQTVNYPRPGRQVTTGIFAQITGAATGAIFQ